MKPEHGFKRNKVNVWLYPPRRRKPRKDEYEWVDGTMALVLVHPRTGTELASLLQSDDPITKKNEAAIHFSGTDHFIDTVLFRHDDCANPRSVFCLVATVAHSSVI